MQNHPANKIFWAEADDDAGRMCRRGDLPRLSLAAYLLLKQSVVIHPAYIWQCDKTREIIVPTSEQDSESRLQLILGNSPNIVEYISDRVTKLQSAAREQPSANSELNQYLKFGNQLTSDSRSLDERFSESGAIHAIPWSRDQKFRMLVREDLENPHVTGDHLSVQLRQRVPAATVQRCIKEVIELTHSPHKLVSVDSVVALMNLHGLAETLKQPIFDRLHLLHWQSHEGAGLHVPLLSRFNDKSLDPLDPIVFWTAIDKLLGPELQASVLKHSWRECEKIVLSLQSDLIWQRFTDNYKSVVITISENYDELLDSVISQELAKRYPSLAWQLAVPSKHISPLGILSVVCTILGFSFGMNWIGWGGTIGTLGDYVYQLAKIANEHFGIGRAAVKARILLAIEGNGRIA